MFEYSTRRYLHMGADEFVAKWNSGAFKGDPEMEHIAADVALMLPLLDLH